MIGAILQARLRSTRLPNKVLLPLPVNNNQTILHHILSRVSRAKSLEQLTVATTTNPEDDVLATFCPYPVFRGDEQNVLSRFYHAALAAKLNVVVRLTGDNPCIDPLCIDQAVTFFLNGRFDYAKTTNLPVGMNIEIISFAALQTSFLESHDLYEQEHVTQFVLRRPNLFNIGHLTLPISPTFQAMRLTVDYPSDYALMNLIYTHFAGNEFTWQELDLFCQQNPWLKEINPNYQKQRFSTTAEELQQACSILQQLELETAVSVLQQHLKPHKTGELP